jgi:3'-phosphoadenosine 5'-phosphosulfate sulfotransferase (PAPS reductase)/FAD synthetase
MTHLIREVRPDIPVLFLDTFHHFPQTLAYRDELTAKWGLTLRAPKHAASGTRWSRSSPRSSTTIRGSPRCAAINRRRART